MLITDVVASHFTFSKGRTDSEPPFHPASQSASEELLREKLQQIQLFHEIPYMNNVIGLLLLLASLIVGDRVGERIGRSRRFGKGMLTLITLMVLSVSIWVAANFLLGGIALAILALAAATKAWRHFPQPIDPMSIRPPMRDGATWGDIHHRATWVQPFARKSDFDPYIDESFDPPPGRRKYAGRPHLYLAANNASRPPSRSRRRRANLRVVK
ncbi:MAG TPA: hypothetical protein V6D17_11450 [Candidatus Obscuribacterales bacterium]